MTKEESFLSKIFQSIIPWQILSLKLIQKWHFPDYFCQHNCFKWWQKNLFINTEDVEQKPHIFPSQLKGLFTRTRNLLRNPLNSFDRYLRCWSLRVLVLVWVSIVNCKYRWSVTKSYEQNGGINIYLQIKKSRITEA